MGPRKHLTIEKYRPSRENGMIYDISPLARGVKETRYVQATELVYGRNVMRHIEREMQNEARMKNIHVL